MGGTTLVTVQAPPEDGGFAMHDRWTHRAISEPTRTDSLSEFADADGRPIEPAAGIPPGVPTEVPHVVELEALPGGRTRVTVTETGYTSGEARGQPEAGQERCTDEMRALFAATRPSRRHLAEAGG